MAEIRPFRGIRYNEGRYADLSSVLAPPQDAVSAAEYNFLCRKCARNAVQLVAEEPGTGRARASYAHAAGTLEDWLTDETLVQDDAPAVYVLDQEAEIGGERRVRRSFIAGLRIEAFGKGCVFAHEETDRGPEKDRLALLKATRMNMVPVLGLYSDENGAVRALLDEMAGLDPVAMGIGTDGVKNVLRAVYHHGLIDRLARALAPKQIVVADGHPSYEAALEYRDHCRQRRSTPSFEEPHEFIAAALIATSAAEWSIRPLHRLVRGLKRFKAERFFGVASENYDVEEIPSEAPAILARLSELDDRHAFGMVTRNASRVLVRKPGAHPGDESSVRVDTSVLREEVFEGILSMDLSRAAAKDRISYTDDAHGCVTAVKHRRGDLGVLVNPTSIEEVEALAFAGEMLPPKSAAFRPKVPGGLVIAPVI